MIGPLTRPPTRPARPGRAALATAATVAALIGAAILTPDPTPHPTRGPAGPAGPDLTEHPMTDTTTTVITDPARPGLAVCWSGGTTYRVVAADTVGVDADGTVTGLDLDVRTVYGPDGQPLPADAAVAAARRILADADPDADW